MASRLFFDPMTALRLAPLITSTVSVWYSHDQYFFLNNFMDPKYRDKSNAVITPYFTRFFTKGIWVIFTMFTLSFAGGVANFYWKPNVARNWYAAGAVLALSHYAFVPTVVSPVRAIFEDESKGNGTKDLQKWLNAHKIRTWLVDVPAWACFLTAVLMSLKPI